MRARCGRNFEVLELLLLNILAPVLAVAGVFGALSCFGFILPRGTADARKSQAEAKGDPAMKLELTRLACRLIGFLATLMFIVGWMFGRFSVWLFGCFVG
jgi:hypothetical protein